MKGQLMQEIQRLTRLIEQRKKMASHTIGCNKSSYCSLENAEKTNLKSTDDSASLSNVHVHLDRQFATANVHVNPNFKVQNPVIYINPRMQTASRIHVNPRIIKDVSKLNDGKYSYSNAKCSVYVNPKLMTKLSSSMRSKIMDKRIDVPTSTEKNNCSHLKYVKNTDTLNVGSSIINAPTMGDRRFNNSSVIVLSRRKLIRVRRTVKGSSVITPTVTPAKTKKFLRSPFTKIKSTPLKTVKRSIIEINTLRSSGRNDHTFEPNEIIAKCGRYKIDRTNHFSSLKVKGGSMDNNTAIITVGGIPYKSSRNQLVHGNLSLKKKRVPKNDKFIVARSGKNLHRLKVVKDTNNRIAHHSVSHLSTRIEDKCGITLSQKTNYKNSMSTKAKRRSIQILWNKMRKNNQPCLLFQKFGYCANYKSGICPKLHDRKQVSLCKRFLQGKCFADNCPLSHDVGPEKMPTCKYFLEGCCTRDACPYLHVKMSSNTLICMDFLKGYCAKGNECNRRHEFMCPEFDKSRKCSKGKYCPYPHKPQTSAIGHTDKHLQTEPKGSRNNLNVIAVVGVNNNNTTTTTNTTATTTTTTNTTITTTAITTTTTTTITAIITATATATIANNNNNNNGNVIGHTKTIVSDAVCTTIVPSTHENRLRYYERRATLNDDINERKEAVIKKINIMKGVEIVQRSHMRHDVTTDAAMRAISSQTGFIEVKEYTCNQSAKTDYGKPMKRRPIGSLPAYIPID